MPAQRSLLSTSTICAARLFYRSLLGISRSLCVLSVCPAKPMAGHGMDAQDLCTFASGQYSWWVRCLVA